GDRAAVRVDKLRAQRRPALPDPADIDPAPLARLGQGIAADPGKRPALRKPDAAGVLERIQIQMEVNAADRPVTAVAPGQVLGAAYAMAHRVELGGNAVTHHTIGQRG